MADIVGITQIGVPCGLFNRRTDRHSVLEQLNAANGKAGEKSNKIRRDIER